jgi:hypothetical protein
MRHQNGNDPAFPWTLNEDMRDEGMSMREWYAGMALQGILASCAGDDTNLADEKKASRWAFKYADAMLVQAKEPPSA